MKKKLLLIMVLISLFTINKVISDSGLPTNEQVGASLGYAASTTPATIPAASTTSTSTASTSTVISTRDPLEIMFPGAYASATTSTQVQTFNTYDENWKFLGVARVAGPLPKCDNAYVIDRNPSNSDFLNSAPPICIASMQYNINLPFCDENIQLNGTAVKEGYHYYKFLCKSNAQVTQAIQEKQKAIEEAKRKAQNDFIAATKDKNRAYIGEVDRKNAVFIDFQCDSGEYINQLSFHPGDFVNPINVICSNGNSIFEKGSTLENKSLILSAKGFSGFNSRSGSWIDSLTGLDIDKKELQPKIGGEGGNDQGNTLHCPENQILVGLTALIGGEIPSNPPYPTPYLNALAIYCSKQAFEKIKSDATKSTDKSEIEKPADDKTSADAKPTTDQAEQDRLEKEKLERQAIEKAKTDTKATPEIKQDIKTKLPIKITSAKKPKTSLKPKKTILKTKKILKPKPLTLKPTN